MPSQVDVAETTFSQFLAHFVFTEAAAWVKVLSSSRVEDCFIFYVFKIILKILCTIRVEQSYEIDVKQFFDVIECDSFVGGFDFEGFAIVAAAIVDVILNRSKDTIFSSAFL